MAKLMIVDDSSFARRVHRNILETGGHSVVEASTGMGAIETYFLERPDVVVLDLSMSDLGGVDVLRRLKEMDAQSRVIVVSADVQRSTEQSVSDAGAAAFLGKPVDSARLLAAVSSLVDAEGAVKPS